MIIPYYNKHKDFVLYNGDTNDILEGISEKVDMIFADPPYFLSNQKITTQFGKLKIRDKGEWDRPMTWDQMNLYNKRWLSKCRNVLKEDGTIWVCGTYHNIYSVEQALIELGFKILNIVVSHKIDPPPTP